MTSARPPDRFGGCFGTVAQGVLPYGRSIQSNSRAEARASVERVFFSHDLGAIREPGDVDFTLRSCRVGTTSFNFIRYGVDIDVSAHDGQPDRYVFVAPLSGNCVVKYLGRSHYVDPGGFIILQPSAPFDFAMSADHSHIGVGITRADLAYMMTRQYGGYLEPTRFVLPTTTSGQTEDHMILKFLAFMCEQLATPNFAAGGSPFARILEQSFLSLVSAFMTGEQKDIRHAAAAERVPRHVLLAEKFMRDNIEQDISADDIVAASGAPMRTLYHSFRKYRGVSPLAWIRSERLNAARWALLHPRHAHTTVTEIASLYCTSNFGRFSREYHHRFGEYPSQTLHRSAAAVVER
jgi:AraC-like DNA-binding protein